MFDLTGRIGKTHPPLSLTPCIPSSDGKKQNNELSEKLLDIWLSVTLEKLKQKNYKSCVGVTVSVFPWKQL